MPLTLSSIASYIPFVNDNNIEQRNTADAPQLADQKQAIIHNPVSANSSNQILQNAPAVSAVGQNHAKKLKQADIDYESLPDDSPLVAQLTAGAFAGIMEHSLMYPVDVIKTRMQLYLNTTSVPSRSAAEITKNMMPNSIIGSLMKVSSSEGSFALWRGISSVLLGAGPAHAVYFGVFEHTKTLLVNSFTKNKDSQITTYITDENHPLIASAAGIAGTTASDALMTPFDILKQRMQTIRSVHQKKEGTSVKDIKSKFNIFTIGHKIYQREGIKAFWISYPATLLLNIPFAAINFGVYEYGSSILNPEHTYNPLLHCLAGAISGASAAAVTNPLDFVKTFLQTKGLSDDPKIRNINGFKAVVTFALKPENGGWKNFLKGIRPRILFNVPSTAISWTSYEMAKSYLC